MPQVLPLTKTSARPHSGLKSPECRAPMRRKGPGIRHAKVKMTIIPRKLQAGDEIRVVSPATSLAVISDETRHIALKNLTDMGFKVTFSKNSEECDMFAYSGPCRSVILVDVDR